MRGRGVSAFERCGGRRRRTQMRRKAIDRLTSSGSRCVWRAVICSCVRFPRQGMPPRFVVSKPLHTMTNDVQREITLPKARSARCRREGGRGEVWSAGEVQARFGRDTGEMQARRDCGRACKRDPNEIQARFTGRVAPAARRGRGEHGVSQPKQHERRGFEWRVPHGHWRTAKICGRKEKGRGQPRTKRAPRSPPPRHRPCCLLWTTFATTGRRTSIQTLRLGSAPSASAATSSPHSAPQQCDPNDCGGEGGSGDERCTVVGAVEAREDGGVPAPRPQCLGTRGARRSGSASSRSWA